MSRREKEAAREKEEERERVRAAADAGESTEKGGAAASGKK